MMHMICIYIHDSTQLEDFTICLFFYQNYVAGPRFTSSIIPSTSHSQNI